jgi:threonine/homoserine/homoserine lactone efflux protein
MAQAIGAVLAFAVGVGISPIPIVAVILMLFSARARVNGPVFALGWVLGLAVVVSATYLLAGTLDVGTGSSDDGVSWFKVVLGVLLLSAGARRWRRRPGPGEQAEMPKWMASVDHVGPGRAFGLALLLSVVNPKNLMLALGAGTSLAQTDPSSVEAVVGVIAFVLIGSSVVLIAVGYDLLAGERARTALDSARTWLSTHDDAVMATLFLVFGAVLLSQGLSLRG